MMLLVQTKVNSSLNEQSKKFARSQDKILGHDHLLEIRLLKKSARHNFSFAQHHLSKCHFFVNCSKIKNHEKSSAVRVFRAVSLLDKKILTA